MSAFNQEGSSGSTYYSQVLKELLPARHLSGFHDNFGVTAEFIAPRHDHNLTRAARGPLSNVAAALSAGPLTEAIKTLSATPVKQKFTVCQ